MKIRMEAVAGRLITAILICSGFYYAVRAEGQVCPEEEERIIEEEISAGRMREIIPPLPAEKPEEEDQEEYGDVQELPEAFDRSQDKASPPIRAQRGGSCTGWATTYYSATFQVAKREGWDAAEGGDQYRFSPHWTYNLINNGVDAGGSMTNNNEVMIQHGVATWSDFEYGVPNRHTSWPVDADIWRDAIPYRMESKAVLRNIHTTEGLRMLKEFIYDPMYGVTFSTNSPTSGTHWIFTTIQDNPSSTVDDPYVGEYACYYVLENQGGRHALTVVGWNDHIWIDVNQNGRIDPGEIGALKIAESHGVRKANSNSGYYWLAYDALFETSQVPGGPSSGREPAFLGQRVNLCELKESYTPMLFAEFTLQTAARNDVQLRFMRTSTTATPPFSNPEASWEGYVFGSMIYRESNRIGFDGNDYSSNPSDAPEGTFVFDLTDIYPSGTDQDWRYVMRVRDRASGLPVTVSSFKVIYPSREDSLFVAQQTPVTVDDDTDYLWVDIPAAITPVIAQERKSRVSAPFALSNISVRGMTFAGKSLKSETVTFNLYNLAGRCVWSYRTKSSGSGAQSIAWNGISEGVYIINVAFGNHRSSEKLVITH